MTGVKAGMTGAKAGMAGMKAGMAGVNGNGDLALAIFGFPADSGAKSGIRRAWGFGYGASSDSWAARAVRAANSAAARSSGGSRRRMRAASDATVSRLPSRAQ